MTVVRSPRRRWWRLRRWYRQEESRAADNPDAVVVALGLGIFSAIVGHDELGCTASCS